MPQAGEDHFTAGCHRAGGTSHLFGDVRTRDHGAVLCGIHHRLGKRVA